MTTFPQAVLDDLAASRADSRWPTAANTGHNTALTLTVHTGTYTTPAGWANTTITGHQFDKLVINVANVTFSNCLFRATTGGYMIQLSSGIGQTVFDHCTLDGGDVTDQILMAGSGYLMNRCNVYHGADGPRVTTNTIITNNYIHHMTRKGTLHPDCLQITGSRDITITGNRLESWNDTLTAGTSAVDSTRTLDLNNSCLQVGDNTGSTTNVVFSGNLMSGGNYSLNMAGGTGKSGVTYSNNTWIAGLYRYGAILRGTGATLQVDGGGNGTYVATGTPPVLPPAVTRIDLATSDAATLTQGTLDPARIGDGALPVTKLDSATQAAIGASGSVAAATTTTLGTVLTSTAGGTTPTVPLAANVLTTALKPSGDTTGLSDKGTINAALAASTQVVLAPGQWYINGPIVIPSNTTLMLDGARVLLVNGSNSWIVCNANMNSTGDDNIVLAGRNGAALVGQTGSLLAANVTTGTTTISLSTSITPGTYWLGESYDVNTEQVTVNTVTGTGPYTATLAAATTKTHTTANVSWCASQLRVQTNRYLSAGVQFVNVRGLTIEGMAVGPANFLTINPQGCTDVVVRNIRLVTDSVTPNQDGIDFFGCQRVRVTGITGRTGDDFSYITSQTTTAAIHPYLRTTSTMPNTYDISYRDITVEPSANMFRIMSGDGKSVKKVRVTDAHSLQDGAAYPRISLYGSFLEVGTNSANGAVTTLPAPGDLADVQVSHITVGRMNLACVDFPCSNIRIAGWLMDRGQHSLISQRSTTAVVANDFIIADGQAADATATSGSIDAAVIIPSGSTFNGLRLTNIRLSKANSFIANTGGAVNGADMKNIHVGTLYSDFFTGSGVFHGSVDGVTIDATSGSPKTYGRALAMRIGPGMPPVTTADTVPNPTVGAQIMCATNVDPTGGAGTTPGVWIADGTAWNRIVTLANNPATPPVTIPSAPTGLTATGAAGAVNLTWSASSGATTYNVYRGTTAAGESATALTTGVTGTSYSDTTGTAGTTYYYNVKALNTAGSSAASNEASAAPSASGGGSSFTDDFNRADATTTGNGWTAVGTATWPISTNQVRVAGTSTTATTSYYNIAPFTATSAANMYSQIDVTAVGTTTTPGHPRCIINWADSSNHYFGYYDATTSTGGWKIFKVAGGTSTQIGSTGAGGAPTVPYTLRLQNIAGTLTLLANGSTMATATDSTLTGTGAGILIRGGGTSSTIATQSENQRADNFAAGAAS